MRIWINTQYLRVYNFKGFFHLGTIQKNGVSVNSLKNPTYSISVRVTGFYNVSIVIHNSQCLRHCLGLLYFLNSSCVSLRKE